MIDRSAVEKIASLARLELSDAEMDAHAHELAAVLGYIEQLNSVDTEGVEPTAYMVPEHDPLRNDTVVQSLPKQAALANGPKVKNGYFAVPKVIG